MMLLRMLYRQYKKKIERYTNTNSGTNHRFVMLFNNEYLFNSLSTDGTYEYH